MSFDVQVRRVAEVDVAEAQLWYETQSTGLGAEFLREVAEVIWRLSETPFIYQVVYRDVRRALVRRFPFIVWYRIRENVVVVLACTHGRQDPDRVKSRF